MGQIGIEGGPSGAVTVGVGDATDVEVTVVEVTVVEVTVVEVVVLLVVLAEVVDVVAPDAHPASATANTQKKPPRRVLPN